MVSPKKAAGVFELCKTDFYCFIPVINTSMSCYKLFPVHVPASMRLIVFVADEYKEPLLN